MSSTTSTASCTLRTSRSTFESNLKKEKPSVPLVESRVVFDAFVAAGRELCELHVGYETVEPCPLTEEWAAGADPETNPDLLLVSDRKMSYAKASVPGTGHGKARPRSQPPALQRLPHAQRHPARGARIHTRRPLGHRLDHRPLLHQDRQGLGHRQRPGTNGASITASRATSSISSSASSP